MLCLAEFAEMSPSTQMTIQTVVLIVVGLVSSAMVPWAFIIERRLARLEVKLGNGFARRIDKLSDDFKTANNDIHKLQTKVATMDLSTRGDHDQHLARVLKSLDRRMSELETETEE